MSPVRIKWTSLLKMTDLDMEGDFPRDLMLEDTMQLSLAWLTAINRTERKLLRCDGNGALLLSDPWNGFISVEEAINEVANSTEDTVTWTTANQGILISTGVNLVHTFFKRVNGGDDEAVYIPADSFYWFPHSCYSVRMRCVPYPTGGAAVHGLTAFN